MSIMTDRHANRIKRDGITYYVEYIWRYDPTYGNKDYDGRMYPVATEGETFGDKTKMIQLITLANRILKDLGNLSTYQKAKNCPICGAKRIDKGEYVFIDRIWPSGIIHYIKNHNIEPTHEFKDFLYNTMMSNLETELAKSIDSGIFCDNIKRDKIESHKVKRVNKHTNCRKIQRYVDNMILNRVMINNEEYIKLEKNKILILDALMISGGRFKKYDDPYNTKLKRYSEHAGFLDFENGRLQKIVVSGQTDRVDDGDDEIFLPKDMTEMMDYEYIFHTHPPTPKPGGRSIAGIMFEFPSVSDIFHFIDHYNDGNVIGSLVIAPEGMYNIRRYIDTEEELKKIGADISRTNIDSYGEIDVDDTKLYDDYHKNWKKIQNDAIEQYGTDFTVETFYSRISQDMSFINRFNRILNRYQINIDYYPRKKDGKYWYIDTVFLKFRYYYETHDE